MRELNPLIRGSANLLPVLLVDCFIFICLAIKSTSASIAIENVDFDLVRLGPFVPPAAHSTGTGREPEESSNVSNLHEPLSAVESKLINANQPDEPPGTPTALAAHKVPVYHSAPKQIDTLGALAGPGKLESPASEPLVERVVGRQSNDLAHAAAGHYAPRKKHKKQKSKKTVKVAKRKKKKTKKKKKKKKKIIRKKKKVVVAKKKVKVMNYKQPKKHHQPDYHQHEPTSGHGKYYEFRSVPEKGSWKFAFKRGNEKHKIERDEHGHKSYFKTLFKWKDPKGLGKHLFDYNHGDHHKHKDKKKKKKYHAAASEEAPKAAKVNNNSSTRQQLVASSAGQQSA